MDTQIGSNAIYTASMQVFNYRVDVGGVTIYRGRAIASPSGRATVNVSNIVEDYLNSEEFPKRNAEPVLYSEDGGYVKARLYRINADETTTLVGEYGFLRSYDIDWSAGIYDSREEVWTGQSITMSNPINGRLDPRMQQLYTVYRRTSGETISWGIAPKFRIIPNKIIAGPDGGTYTLIIEANVPFTATTDSGWVSISGSGGTYVVTVTPNPGEDRKGGIILSYLDENDNPATADIPVVQQALSASIIPESIDFGPDGGESRFTVVSNIDVTPTSSADWLTFVPVRTGDGFVTYKLVVDPNRDGYDDRTATINARGAVLNINQEALKITVNIDTTEYSWTEGEGELIVTANGRYEITTDVEWLRVVPASGQSGTTRFSVIVDENDTIYEREGHIIIGGTVITITQARQSYIAITPMTWTAAATGGSMDFQISDRFEHSWKIRSSGIFNVSQTAGTGNATVTISIGPRTSTSSYTAVPKLVDLTTGEKIQFVLKQAAPIITVTPSTINAEAIGGTFTFTVFSEIDYILRTDSEWITLSATGGTAGTTVFTATISPNATLNEKTGHIKVFNSNKITVIQEASQIAVSPTHINAYALGSGYTVTVTSNTIYNITTDSDWVTVVPTSGGSGVTQFIVYVDDNELPSARTATVYVEYIPVTITQEALSITLSSESGSTYPDSPSRTVIVVTSNGKYRISAESDWIETDIVSGTSGTTILTISNTEANRKGLRSGFVSIGYQKFLLCNRYSEESLNYFTFTVVHGGTITWNLHGSGYQTIYYSKNGGDWTALSNTYGAKTLDVVSGDVLRFKAFYEGGTTKTQYDYSYFGGTAKVDIRGNILSLAYLDDFAGAREVPVENYWICLLRDANLRFTTYFIRPTNKPLDEEIRYKYLKQYCGPGTPYQGWRANLYTPTVQDADDYLTFEIIEGGNLSWTAAYAYSINGASWVRPSERTVAVRSGDKVRLCAGWNDSAEGRRINSLGSFSRSTASFNLSGNVASLIFHTEFANEQLIGGNTFNGLFAGTKVVDASRLKVPQIFTKSYYLKKMFAGCQYLTAIPDLRIADHIPAYNYEEMFSGCTSVTVAENLPILNNAGYVGTQALHNMFYGCSALSRVKDVSNVTASETYGDWLYGVASVGTFEKRESVDTWSRGTSGIPYNWIVEDVKLPATVSPDVFMFSYSGDTATLSILDSDNAGWSISGVPDWITLSSASGTGDTTVSIIVEGTSSAESRYVYVSFNSCGKSVIIAMEQGGLPVATIEPTSAIFSAEGGEQVFNITDRANLGWSIYDVPEWITISQASGTGSSAVSMIADSNFAGTDRSATISFASSGVVSQLTVQQGSSYADNYLTFKVLSNGVIGWTRDTVRKTIYYSKNGGRWNEIVPSYGISVVNGDIVRFKGTETGFNGAAFRGTTVRYEVYGNIMSLLYGDDFRGQTALTTSNTFRQLFRATGVEDASNLVLPATTLTEACYMNMFSGCTNLTAAPELPADNPTFDSYKFMFRGCTSLNYIKCLYDWENIGATDGWVYNVASTGTFVKKSGSSWPTGQNGIPTGWTVEEV